MSAASDLFHGLFHLRTTHDGATTVAQNAAQPAAVPCPTTGRPLRVQTVEGPAQAICPRCSLQGLGGYVSFVGDLRMAYACPSCRELVWLAGA